MKKLKYRIFGNVETAKEQRVPSHLCLVISKSVAQITS